jgi:hypothetical protein
MVKPHMVKKCASPGTVHCRSLLLTGDLDDLGLGDLSQTLPTTWRRLTRTNEFGEPVEASTGDGEEDDRDRRDQ